jgi:hypothetical protein
MAAIDEASCNSTVERAADAYFYYSQQYCLMASLQGQEQNLITGTAIAGDVFEEVSKLEVNWYRQHYCASKY